MSPQLGQGVNMALLDAFVLAQNLTLEDDLEAGLHRYTQRRSAHINWYRRFSHWLTPMFQSEYDTLARARDFLFLPMSRLPGAAQIAGGVLAGSFAGRSLCLPKRDLDK